MKKIFLLFALLLTVVVSALAQIEGEILDASDGYPIPYASATYAGHHKAVSSDGNGKFKIERHNGWRLTFTSVGYQPQVINITSTTPQKIVVKLKPETKKLNEVVINSKRQGKYSRKNNPAVEFMRKVIAAKKRTNLKNHDFYQYNNYQKMTLALNDISPGDLDQGKFKKYQWLVNQVEMCPYNNKLILPISVEETVTQKLYRKNPRTEKSIIQGENATGVNDIFQTGDIINTVLKDVFTDVDIYDDQVRLFQYPFTSPIGKDAIAFYRFYITDTTYVGKDRCIHLDFLPNNQQDFGFRGQLYVLDDSSYQVRRVELTIPKKSDVNWVENMQCMQEFEQLDNGEWVMTLDDMFVEMYINKLLSRVIVIKNTRHTDYAFDELPKNLLKGKNPVMKNAYAQMRDAEFWNQYRQVELSQSESGMEQFIQKLESIKGFKYIVFGLKALIENFVETGTKKHPSKVDIGPINTIISHNFYDGVRLRASAQTTANLSPHFFLKGYYAYGTKSREHYYSGEFTYSFNKKEYLPREFPKQTLTFTTSRDVELPSDKYIQTDKDNVFTALKVHKIDKMFLTTRQQLHFDYEQEWGFKVYANAKTEKIRPIGNIRFQRMCDVPQGEGVTQEMQDAAPSLDHIRYTEFTAGVRFAPGETFINTKQHRWPINLDAPIFRLQHTMGFKGFLGGRYNYNITELEIYKRIWMPMNWGKIDMRVKAGAQWNRVPYPLLIMPAANLSYIIEEETFNLINNMEFLNDRYATLEMSWDLNGKIFNRIPLIRSLKWREFIGIKMLWGSLTDKNNPLLPQNADSEILMRFPEGCYILDSKKPYWEMCVGIHNIFKLLHVEYVRRLNYLDLPTAQKHSVRFMIRTTF